MQPRAAWTKKYKTWQPFLSECVWCGDPFRFFAPMAENGEPKGRLRYCKRSCITEARWEGKKKLPRAAVLADLYILKSLSIPTIARMFNSNTSSVGKVLRDAGTPMRKHTGTRICVIKGCGKPAHKVFSSCRAKDGTRKIFGRHCEKHRKERARQFAFKYSRRDDPLIGTRKTGRKKRTVS